MSVEAATTTAEAEGEKTWTEYMSQIYFGRKPPVLGTLYMDELEQRAKDKLKGYPSRHPPLPPNPVLPTNGTH